MSRSSRTATRGSLVPPDELKKNLAHPEWFHVYREGDATHVNVNLYRVPAPDRVLVSNVTAVASAENHVNLLFGQSLPGSSKLYGLMNMIIPVEQMRRTIYASAEFSELLGDYAKTNHLTASLRNIAVEDYPTERIVTERATLVSIAFSNHDCEWRFYRVSPTDIRAANEGHPAAVVVYPVVQVLMGTSELVHLMHSLKRTVAKEEAT